jgi:hypothetical protein
MPAQPEKGHGEECAQRQNVKDLPVPFWEAAWKQCQKVKHRDSWKNRQHEIPLHTV